MTIKATLIKSHGDALVVDAARASFAKTHDTYTSEQNERLIRFLASAEPPHFTPFTHPRFTFRLHQTELDVLALSQCDVAGMVWRRCTHDAYGVWFRHSLYGWVNLIKKGAVKGDGNADRILSTLSRHAPLSGKYLHREWVKDGHQDKIDHPHFIDVTLLYEVPIFVARQEFKHMVGFTRNERSGRYVTANTEFYRPKVWRKKPDGSIKQGSGANFTGEENQGLRAWHRANISITKNHYSNFIETGAAPEMARMVLPQSMITSYVVTANLTGLARFVYQRTKPDAQKEIQDLAHQVNALLKQEFGS